jgi:hypothetical protein
MKSTNFNLVRYDADEGKVFDWAEPRFNLDEDGEEIQIHLYAKTLFIGINDSIDNYIEVDEVIEEPEIETEEEVIEEV